MSFLRFVYYTSIVCGWCAFLAWAITEVLGFHSGIIGVGLTSAFVGSAIGFGLSVVSARVNSPFRQSLIRGAIGAGGGAIGGLIGGVSSELMFITLGWFLGGFAEINLAGFNIGVNRVLSWGLLGILIGITDGCYEHSVPKIKKGLIGGLIGGLVAGLLFDLIAQSINSPTGMSSRATGFVILGLCIGAFVGLVHVVMKQAWLTVMDGFRPGRQLIINQDVILLGRAESAALPFMGNSNQNVERDHAKILHKTSGEYILEDNNTESGTYLNGSRISKPSRLSDDDVIKIGRNFIRFRVKSADSSKTNTVGQTSPTTPVSKPPPPPPPRKSNQSSSSNAENTEKFHNSIQNKVENTQPGSSPRKPPPPPPRKK